MKIRIAYHSSIQFKLSAGKFTSSGLSPQRCWPEIRQIIIDEILEERVEPRRHRRNHRGVKRKMSNYEIANRKRDRTWRDDPAKLIAIIRSSSRKGT